jgi:hypothetical protein
MYSNEICWINRFKLPFEITDSLYQLVVNDEDIQDAELRLQRFAPFIKKCFPETEETELTDAVATTTDQNADPTAESADAGTKKKKSRFTASDEQMTITIPESLSGIEIKEKYVLAITLDDNGSVTALEVASKGHSKSKGASSGEKGAGQEQAPSSGDSAELNTNETTDL